MADMVEPPYAPRLLALEARDAAVRRPSPATEQLRELAQQLLDAAHYSTELSRLEGHCRDIAHKIECLAEGSGDAAARAPEPIGYAHGHEVQSSSSDWFAVKRAPDKYHDLPVYAAQARPDRVAIARALCRQYELDDGFSEEQADRAAASDMHRNFLKAADAAIEACSLSRPNRGGAA